MHTVTHTETICWMTHDCKPLSGIKSELPHKLTLHAGITGSDWNLTRNKQETPIKIYFTNHLILLSFIVNDLVKPFLFKK